MKYKSLFPVTAAVIVCVLLTGCQMTVNKGAIFTRYDQVKLKASASSEVLATILHSDKELLSQSDSVVASWGHNRKASVLWFTAVAFDEEELTAVRKYALVADEITKDFYVKPAQKLRFDADVVIGIEVLDAAYANDNERRIAVLREAMRAFGRDMNVLTPDSKVLESGVMAANQALHSVMHMVEQSPAFAVRMSEVKGLEFQHISLGPGRVQVLIDNDIAKIRIKVGKGWLSQTTGIGSPLKWIGL